MPRRLDSDGLEVLLMSPETSSHIVFEYAGARGCYSCSTLDHTFVTGDEIQESNGVYLTSFSEHARCAECIDGIFKRILLGSIFDELSEYEANRLQLSIFMLRRQATEVRGNHESCYTCGRPASEGNEIVTGVLDSDNRDLPVHLNCVMWSWACTNCDNRYAVQREMYSRRVYYEVNAYDNRTMSCVQVDSDQYCQHCFDRLNDDGEIDVVTCIQCEEYTYDSNASTFRSEYYCENCYSNYIYSCSHCDELYHSDDSYEHDHEDNDDDDNSVIHSYSYKPATEFFGSGKYYLGFELEVEAYNHSRFTGAEMAQDKLGAHAYMKDDGSLNDGFEIVTHPHTLEAYASPDFKWSFLEDLRRNSFKSWNTGTCGLHVHVSRTAFEPVRESYSTRAERVLLRQAHELRFMKLIYDNQRQVERIAGRSNNHYSSFQDKGSLIPKVKQGYQGNGRYSAINTENSATLEVRVFRGSLKETRVRSALEFVHAAVEYTRDLKVTGKNNALSWVKFLTYVVANEDTYPNLLTIINQTLGNEQIND